jgi:nucleotide-binding universal stress UspA family protein
MYQKILIPVENSVSDATIIEHIKPLARINNAKLFFIHVSDGWAARNHLQLNLAESEEIQQDRAYLENLARDARTEGFTATHFLAMGEPYEEIIKYAKVQEIDLIAMSTHGHRLFQDIIYGSTADKVRHMVSIPVLMLRAKAVALPK